MLQIIKLKKDLNELFLKKIKNRILDEEIFWPRIQSVLKILKSVVRDITQLESDKAIIISDAIAIFYNLSKVIENDFIEKNDELNNLKNWQTILKAVNDRSETCLPIHFAMYLLKKNLINIQLIYSYEIIEKLVSHLKI